MADLSPECRLWFDGLSPEIQRDLSKLGVEKVEEIFSALKQFGNEVTMEDLRGGDSNKLSKVYKKKLIPHVVNGQLSDSASPLTMAHSLLKGLIPSKIDYSQEQEVEYFKGLDERNKQAIEKDKALATRGEVSMEEKAAKTYEKAAETEERAAKKESETVKSEEQKFSDLIKEEEERYAKQQDQKRRSGIDPQYRRSEYAKDSLRAAPGAAFDGAKALSTALSNDYFDILLMLLGFGFGIYLSVVYYWIFGIPLIVGAFLIGLHQDPQGKSIWGKFIKSVISPTGKFATSMIPMSIILFAGLIALFIFTTNGARIAFDPFQFIVFSLANTLLLLYLWTGIAPSSPYTPKQLGGPLAVRETGSLVPIQKPVGAPKEETALATRGPTDVVNVSKGELEEIKKELAEIRKGTSGVPAVREQGNIKSNEAEQKALAVIENREIMLKEDERDAERRAEELRRKAWEEKEKES